MPESANIARYLGRKASALPAAAALKIPRGRDPAGAIDYLTLSFAELDAEVGAWVRHLRQRGVQPGDRVLVMVRQGLPLIAAAFALFHCGAVPILIDPGMGLKSFLSCVHRSHPTALLGIPLAQLLSQVFRPTFRTVKTRITASGSAWARRTSRAPSATQSPLPSAECEPLFRRPQDLAAILFTSGSTGAPKGVCYEHGMFEAQVRLIQATYQIQPGEIDLPMLPIFALFNPALGMTTVVPEIDPTRPAAVDPAKLVQAIRQENVTNSFGSPTLWSKISRHCIKTGTTLPSLRRVLCAGAPVPVSLWEEAARILPNGQLHSPYGATEALPVSSLSAATMASLRHRPPPSRPLADQPLALQGTCLGTPVAEVKVKVIALTEGPIRSIDHVEELRAGEIGEFIVSGPVVTTCYDGLPEATAAAKISGSLSTRAFSGEAGSTDEAALGPPAKSGGAVWHRLGDCGYLDKAGRLWFCGRKVERVETAAGLLYTEPCELIFRAAEGVARCALIGLGDRPNQIPGIVIEPENPALSMREKRALAHRLRERGSSAGATRAITRFYFHPHFPVDVRHNAKIHRLALARWAAGQKPIL